MCFSATASFTAAGVLSVAGGTSVALTVRRRDWRALSFAAVPFLFAVQQVIEGVVWLESKATTAGQCLQGDPATMAFSIFAFTLWPIWTPLSVALLERRVKLLQRLLIPLGLAVGLYLLYFVLTDPPRVTETFNGNLFYNLSVPYLNLMRVLYVIVTVAYLTSSYREARWCGALIGAGFAVSYIAWQQAYVSVWCFFAAWTSIMVCYAVWKMKTRQPATQREAPVSAAT